MAEVRTLRAEPDGVGDAPPSAFWEGFVARHWEREPLECRLPSPEPLATPEELFRCLLAASARLRAGEEVGPAQFYRDDGLYLSGPGVGRFLPEPTDGSLEAYAARVSRQLDGRRFALLFHWLLESDAELWLRARDLMAELVARVRPRRIQDTLFLGNYEQTPFGVHKDETDVLLVPVLGRKRILTWADDRYDGGNDPGPRREDAAILEAGPGELLYWPGRLWHIGEGVGGLSATLNFGFLPYDPMEDMGRQIAANFAQRFQARLSVPAATAAPLGDSVAEALDAARAVLPAVLDDPQLELELRISLLLHESRCGFARAPAPRPWRVLEDEEAVRTSPHGPIQWLPAPEDEIVVAATGQSLRLPADPGIVTLFERLNSGAWFRVGELVESTAGERTANGVTFRASPAGVRTTLSRLYSLHVLHSPD